MASSKVEIWNMALGHIGISHEIETETERSAERAACSRFYDNARQEVLRDFPWPFATELADLTLVDTAPDVPDNWGYSYTYPTAALRFHRIVPATSPNTIWNPQIPMRVVRSGGAKLILTNQVDAVGEYTIDVTSVAEFPPDFVEALSLLLARLIAPRLMDGDPAGLAKQALELYDWRRRTAQVNAVSEDEDDTTDTSSFERARGSS